MERYSSQKIQNQKDGEILIAEDTEPKGWRDTHRRRYRTKRMERYSSQKIQNQKDGEIVIGESTRMNKKDDVLIVVFFPT